MTNIIILYMCNMTVNYINDIKIRQDYIAPYIKKFPSNKIDISPGHKIAARILRHIVPVPALFRSCATHTPIGKGDVPSGT